MPKIGKGIFITCEKTITMFIKKINEEHGKDIILQELDDTHIIINESKLTLVQDKVFEMQDENSFNPILVSDNK